MPKSMTNQQRGTETLHAPWWSDAKAEDGTHLERVVIWHPQTERDSQWITEQVQKVASAKARSIGSGREQAAARLTGGLETQRMFTLMRMVVSMTDETGHEMLPPGMASLELKIDWWRGVPEKDMSFIAKEIDQRNEPDQIVLPKDMDEAEANLARGIEDVDRLNPEEIARSHFRPTDEVGVLGRTGDTGQE